jgi:Arc/MetJ family transcription regulator
MRITVEIDEQDLKRVQAATGQKKISPAVSKALAEYLRSRRKAKLIERALGGKTDYSRSNEQLEEMDVYETR